MMILNNNEIHGHITFGCSQNLIALLNACINDLFGG